MTTQPPDEQLPLKTVAQFFRAIDVGDWTTAQTLLTDPVDVAHGSNNMTLSSEALTSGWKQLHAQYAATHYELTSVSVEFTAEDQATARLSSRATLTRPKAASLVIEGHYTVTLERPRDTWIIRSIRHDEAPAHDGSP